MSTDAVSETTKGIEIFEISIPIRGCPLDLKKIAVVYRALEELNLTEGKRVVGQLTKLDNETEEAFESRKAFSLRDAFKLTTSIIGENGVTSYGETEALFSSNRLPIPIKTIFFTNENAFKRNANGNRPRNAFSVSLSFDKPPLFDPNPLVSEPTRNDSAVEIRAEDMGFFSAVQHIVNTEFTKKRHWYHFIHGKFIYDLGLWIAALPYSLYYVTRKMDQYLPAEGPYASFRIPFFIYFLGMSLFLYRTLTSYLKWALPVNTLTENNDQATGHRVIFALILIGVLTNAIYDLAKFLL